MYTHIRFLKTLLWVGAFSVFSIQAAVFTLTSAAFKDNNPIPSQYTCVGKNVSPPLAWSGAPTETRSYVLLTIDPDTLPRLGYRVIHWVVFNIPKETQSFAEGSVKGIEGTNSLKKAAYQGPCPPEGTHHYFFRLFALDAQLSLPAGAWVPQVMQAMRGHVLAETVLMGTFNKQG